MSCPDVALMQAHLEGFATVEERESVRGHLAGCAACRALVLALAPEPLAGGEEAGRPIGRYLVLRKLGEGGMGVVYAAWDPELNRQVALKLIRPSHDETLRSEVQERLLREGQALARVAHPNVVAVHDVGRHDDQVFVAMELIDGETLSLWLARAQRSTAEVVETFVRAGRGLAAAHAAGLVHRDFKPNNVMIDDSGRVRVMDFGLARPAGILDGALPSPNRLDQTLTASNVLLGTPAYMAPEQLQRAPNDARTDQFSFCVALYEALAGTRPFVAVDVEDLRAAMLASRLQKPRRKVERRLLEVVTRGLLPDPAARWPSMDALLAALSRAPGRRRWQLAIALALLGVTSGFGVLYRHTLRVNRLLCTGAERKLSGVWDAPRRESLRRALQGNFAGIASRFDAYAAAWTRGRTEACEATRVRGEQSEQALDLRVDCFDQRLRELDALVATLSTETLAPGAAAQAAAALTPLGECDQVAMLRGIQRSPVAAAVRQPLLTRLAQVQALLHVNSPRAAAETASLVEEVRKQGVTDLLPRALYYRGITELGANEARADATMRESALASAVVHDDDALVAALSKIVAADADLSQFDQAERAASYAELVTARLGRPAKLDAILQVDLGLLKLDEDQYPAAREHLRRAVAIFENNPDLDPLLHANALWRLSIVDSYDGALAEAAALRARARKIFQLYYPPEAEMFRMIDSLAAHDDYEDGRLAQAVEGGRRVVAAYASVAPRFGSSRAVALSSLGAFLLENGQLSEAEPLLVEARSEAEKSQPPDSVFLGDALLNLGNLELRRGRDAAARPLLERAVSLLTVPEAPDSVDRAEAELALAQALGGGARSLALAGHAEKVLAAHPVGARRAQLVTSARAFLAAHQ